MKNINTVLLGVLALVGIILGIETVELIRDIRKDAAKTQSQADQAFATLNRTLGEQEAYFKKEQEILNSREVQTSLGLGLRTLRNLDKSSIGLDQSMANIRSITEKLASSVPETVSKVGRLVDTTGHSIEADSASVSLLLRDTSSQISETGSTVRDDLDALKPVMLDLDKTVQDLQLTVTALTGLVSNPAINTSLVETAGTMTELHGVSANLRIMTKPQNLALQAGVAIFKFTGLKALTGLFAH